MAGKKEVVRDMFNGIAGRYDFLNHFLSAGIDKIWRRKLVRLAAAGNHQEILDVATGTGDLAIALSGLQVKKITGLDIAVNMLDIAKVKVKEKKLDYLIEFIPGDSENLPFDTNTFDLVTVAFGVRNFEDLDKGLSEMLRVLKPGGRVLILEFSKVTAFPLKQLYLFYSKYILPLMGKMISGHKDAYTYLPESVAAFPWGTAFTGHLDRVGYIQTAQQRLSGGIATIYSGVKK